MVRQEGVTRGAHAVTERASKRATGCAGAGDRSNPSVNKSVATGPVSEHNLRQTSGEDDEVLLVRHDTAVEVAGVRTQRVVKAATACL